MIHKLKICLRGFGIRFTLNWSRHRPQRRKEVTG